MPDAERARDALRNAELVIAQDAYHPTETTALAHVVLPAAQWPEKAGTMVNSERRIQLMRAAIDPPGEAKRRLGDLRRRRPRMGFDGFEWADRRRRLRRVRGAHAGPPVRPVGRQPRAAGATARSSGRAAAPTDPGTARLYTDGRFPTETGGPVLQPALPGHPADPPDADYPLVLTTGRIASQWHTMTRTGKSPELLASDAEPFLELHPEDAKRAWLKDGQHARVTSRRGAVDAEGPLRPTPAPRHRVRAVPLGRAARARGRRRRQRPHPPRDRSGLAPARA